MGDGIATERPARSVTNHRIGEDRAVTVEVDEIGADVNFDIGERGDAIDEIAGHGFGKVAPHEYMNALYVRREVDDRLTRGIAAADERDVLTDAQARLDRRCPIGDAGSLETRKIGDFGPSIGSP